MRLGGRPRDARPALRTEPGPGRHRPGPWSFAPGRSAPPALGRPPRVAGRAAIRESSAAGEPPRPPVLRAAPALAGPGAIGSELTADPGRWSGDPAPAVAFQWRRDGTAIPGAAARAYVPGPEDDGCALDCAITATNAAGAVVAIAGPLRVRRAPPVLVAALPEEVFDQGTGPQRVETAFAFAGADLRFAAAGPAGVAIDPRSGALAVPTDRPVSGAQVTVTATNSGGAAAARLRYAVEADAPERPDAPPALGPGGVAFAPSRWGPAGQAATFSPRLRFPGLAAAADAAIEWTADPDPAAARWGPVRPAPDAPGLHAIFAPGPEGPGEAGPAPLGR